MNKKAFKNASLPLKKLLNFIFLNFYSITEQCFDCKSKQVPRGLSIGYKVCDVMAEILKAVSKAVGLRRFSSLPAFDPQNSKLYLT